jgi:dienelactone hydrolase
MKRIFFLILLACINFLAFPQQTIQFAAPDKTILTADYYKLGDASPFVIMLHEEESSRGEFGEIAPRIRKLGYSCLAVDLRYGNKFDYVKNESSELFKSTGHTAKPYDARMDIVAAINYAYNLSHKPVVLLVSSFSASLCLLEGKKNPKVKAVICFSPGEFFAPTIAVNDSLAGYNKLVFLASTSDESKYLNELAKSIPSVSKTVFSPTSGKGLHGAKCLNKACSTSNEYWLALSLFFRELAD